MDQRTSCGCGDGLGRQFTDALLDAGAEVIISSRRIELLNEVVEEISKTDPKISAIQCDVTIQEDLVRLAKEVGRFGKN
ncbi:MAG: SDR family NAD(P)-dependent oxidoreductase [Candidatus Planktophila sp.]|nr:SDR family NAD(P)-dependent oxidoreductase [Candidatus Planktophila sp.]